MITPLTLQDALNDFLEREVAAKYMLMATDDRYDNTLVPPKIIRSGWVLPRSIDAGHDEAFPYIVTRIEKVENVKGARESIVTMLILLGVIASAQYDENGELIDDGNGYRDFWNMAETARQAIFKHATIEKRFRVIPDFFEAEMLEEQIYPYWEGYLRTKWNVVFPLPDMESEYYR